MSTKTCFFFYVNLDRLQPGSSPPPTLDVHLASSIRGSLITLVVTKLMVSLHLFRNSAEQNPELLLTKIFLNNPFCT